jgi:GNAT superfamily N-acetyltransferase
MTTSYRFYSFGECLYKKNSKTAIVYTALRTIEPDLPDFIPPLNQARENGKQDDYDVNLRGMYCLCIDDVVVSVALLHDNKLDRVITIPKFRRRGYALQLIKHIAEKFVEYECPIILSPVYPAVVPLFEKAGWVKTGTSCPRDGTIDYTLPEMLRFFMTREPAGWDRRGWATHLIFLQTHLFGGRSVP